MFRFKPLHEKGLTKLFIGGMHGDECEHTAPLLNMLAEKVRDEGEYCGEIVIIPCLIRRGAYVSVLRREYYERAEGRRLLSLVRELKPSFYFELHAYGIHALSRLTAEDRLEREGAPPLVEICECVLIGSVSPILRREFGKDDFCLTIELPKWRLDAINAYDRVVGCVLDILTAGLHACTREDILRFLRRRYPAQLSEAERLFKTLHDAYYDTLHDDAY